MEAKDPSTGLRVSFRVLYPTGAIERPQRIGPFAMTVATDAGAEGKDLPVVLVSHGAGGSSLTHRDLGAHLARAGFVVALVEHPGDNHDDASLSHTATNLAHRPLSLRLVLDAVFADPGVGPRLAPAVGVVGHSIGAYTALAIAGGRPSAFPHETPDGKPAKVPVAPDPRIKALVLLAPAAAWFMEDGALSGVRAPILMLTGEKDFITPAVVHARLIERGVPDPSRLEHLVAPGAGHFSFQSPFPQAMRTPGFLPAQDPPGFDRAAFQQSLAPRVEAFLDRELRASAGRNP